MKATIVYLADTETENYGGRLMLGLHKIAGMGFEAARLPLHVSLKQPFKVPGLDEIEDFFDGFSQKRRPEILEFEELQVCESSVFGYDSGCLSLKLREAGRLREIQRELFEGLEERFGKCPAEHDEDYVFHMTVAIGGAPFQEYQRAYAVMKEADYGRKAVFDRLGLFLYDGDEIRTGRYFCYKTAKLAR